MKSHNINVAQMHWMNMIILRRGNETHEVGEGFEVL